MGKKKNARKATPGAPISIEDANPKLAARLRGYEAMASGRGGKGGAGISFSDRAFHRPGSHKK